MAGIRIHVDGATDVRRTLRAAVRAGRDLTPALRVWGEYMLRITRGRFDRQTGPDGRQWAPNTATTISRYVGSYAGTRRRDGELSKKGDRLTAGKRVLQGRTKRLRNEITYKVGANSVTIGTNLPYAAVQQFGQKKGASGKGAPWGDIPARPFLGADQSDRRRLLQEVADHIAGR